MTRKKELFLILLILAIAIFFRFWNLSSIPPGLYHDVAINGNDALDALKSGNFKLFYAENNGREGFFINLIAFSFLIFGPSIFAIRLVAAVIGALTVLGFYFMTKEMFKNIPIALLSSFFLATSFWHTNFSRFGFRAILVPFCLVFCFYFLARALRTKKMSDFIISGAFFGLGFHTYISFRLAVLILIVPIFSACQKFWKDYKTSGKLWETYLKKDYFKWDVWLLAIFIVALPIGIYFLGHPQDFISRAGGISVFAQPHPINSFFESLVKHLGMFNFHGDNNWRHNLAGSPMLPWPLGILFLVGFALSIKEIMLSLKSKDWSLKMNHWIIMVWFFVLLLPGILTAEGLPHDLRVIGVIPPVYIFSGIGAFWVFERTKSSLQNKKVFFIICILFVISIGYREFHKYFIDWAKNPETRGSFSQNFVDIGNYLNSLPNDVQKYVIVNESGVPMPWPNGLPMTAQTPMFIERTVYGEPRTTYVKEEDAGKLRPPLNSSSVIIPMKADENLFKKLKEVFPGGKKISDRGIWMYKIN